MSTHYRRVSDETEVDFETCFFVFMLAFWPVAIVVGLIDFIFITDYDLRLLDIMAGTLAGWVALNVYRSKVEGRGRAS